MNMPQLKWILVVLMILGAGLANAASKEVIDARVKEALATFSKESPAGVELLDKPTAQ